MLVVSFRNVLYLFIRLSFFLYVFLRFGSLYQPLGAPIVITSFCCSSWSYFSWRTLCPRTSSPRVLLNWSFFVTAPGLPPPGGRSASHTSPGSALLPTHYHQQDWRVLQPDVRPQPLLSHPALRVWWSAASPACRGRCPVLLTYSYISLNG